MNQSITAVIPARASDSNIPNKNILPFALKNLLTHKIGQLLSVPSIKTIIVSSDSDEYLDYASSAGAVAVKRPPELSSLDTCFSELVAYILTIAKDQHILWSPVTAPLVDSSDYSMAIRQYYENLGKPYDSLISVERIQRFLLDDNGPLNFRFKPALRSSNKLPILYHYVNAISIAPAESMSIWGYNWGPNPYRFVLPPSKSIDICTLLDYKLALSIHDSGIDS
jgi:CMP-N-acetylneuraminic acid synthetase